MSKKIIARCCICGGPVYSDGSADCDDLESEHAKAHIVDICAEREKFLAETGMTPEEYLKDHNQDNDPFGYSLALFLSTTQQNISTRNRWVTNPSKELQMDYKEKYEKLQRERRFRCPKCGALGRFRITERPSFVFTRCAEYTVKCLECGHFYGVPDDCTG